ncbi:MAG: ABC transporter ATP-binding protein [Oceanicaulis sp.]|uniref:ABC transporter ATP-binding protein n=1 Tax=Maricaulis virginensis TaxID=144022 RepID=A0A9W6IJH7_9PROT|nr:ABC transporter ATP-binding protein [Maricaulis virginensis]MAC39537.1 ABC transporter ATP-binding protein [Oceanicaulis sp.]MAZ92757.1 ABC transporter ATP-binding protein [Maricaulis sp.]MBI75736.1 ABC transporter ATP-binding protein [Oceanicaulis sp.]GLK51467.1 ABC transporter ATP-binding protein [Maricaulis virginensis]
MSAEDILISVRGLRTQFGDHVVHDDLDLDIRRGEILGVVGGSGTGKTVMMNAILGLMTPAAGEIRLNGRLFSEMSAAERRRVDSRWGVLFQNGALFTSLNVLENVMAPLREHVDMPISLMEEIAGMKIGLAGLQPEAATRFPAELSGGMRKRVALARALALDPEILFLDEPTAGLDPIGAAAFDSLVLELSRALGLTIMMITHDLDSLYAICDRVAVLADKRVEVVAPLRELLDHPHPWIQEYFHGPRGRAALAGKEI